MVVVKMIFSVVATSFVSPGAVMEEKVEVTRRW